MLVRAALSDEAYFYDLYFHPEVNPFLLYEMMSREDFTPIFKELQQDGALYIFQNNDFEPIGMAKILPMKHRNSHSAYIGGIAIHPNYWGMGYGKQMVQEIVTQCQLNGFKRLELSTATSNLAAIKTYEKVGFEKEGILSNYTFLKSENRYIDEVLMSFIC